MQQLHYGIPTLIETSTLEECAKLCAELGLDFIELNSNQIDELKKRCVFVVDACGDVVGSCIAWHDLKDKDTIASLHWLVVSPEHQGKHIGLALCQKVMNIFNERGETPVYIHTQPWSYKAILLYIKLGFKIQKTETFSHYENQYKKAIKTLENLLLESQFNQIILSSE